MRVAGRLEGAGKNLVIALSLCAAGFFAAWLRFRPHLERSGVYTDGASEYALDGEVIRHAVWEEPRPLSGEVNSPEREGAPARSADGRWLAFVVGERGANSELWIAELSDEGAREPRPLLALNTGYDELSPAFIGDELWFASNRAGGEGGFDLWRARFDEGHCEPPRPAGAVLNGPRDELDPAAAGPGGALAFASNRESRGRRGCDLYLATPAGAAGWSVSPLQALNSRFDDREPSFSPDGTRVVFSSRRASAGGDLDLFESLRDGDAWLPPTSVAGLTSGADERAPELSDDGFTLWFERGEAADSDLFLARSRELFLRPGPRVGWLDLVVLVTLLVLALLAFLAKRWEAVEVVYKCFLVSVLAHLLLLWWFRHVHPESEAPELEPGSPTFAVRLAASPEHDARRARDGELGPRRPQARGDLAGPAAAARLELPPGRVAADARRALAPDASDLDAAPDPREVMQAVQPTRLAGPVERGVDAPAGPLYDGAAPALALAPAEVGARGERQATRPALERAEHTPSLAAAWTPGPSERDAPRPATAPLPSAPAAATLAASAPAPSSQALEAALTLSEPSLSAPARTALAPVDPSPLEANTPRSTSRGALRPDLGALAPRRLQTQPRARVAPPEVARIELAEPTPSAAPELESFEATPYAARFGPAKERALEAFGGGVETEEAVRAGLEYLARRQHPDGHWGDARHRDRKYGEVHVGKSALAVLAFLGAGHTPASETRHSAVVARGLDYLLHVQDEASGHFGACTSYGHGIATYALAEAYALTHDPSLRAPLERAVAQIARNQHTRRGDRRRFGGWGYYTARGATFDDWPRVSITAWQVMALRSAELGGLQLPAHCLENAQRFLEGALDEERGAFRYSHDPARLRDEFDILPGSTPAALFALHLLGEDLEREDLSAPLAFVQGRAPRGYVYRGDRAFVERATGNLYFWYYGSLALFQRGGGAWRRWNTALRETLLGSQGADGSWAPLSAYARYADDEAGDSIYSTAMCVLTLEVYYRYFTPLLSSALPARR